MGLVGHLNREHSCAIDSVERTFGSFYEFSTWKEEEERVSHSWFVMHTAPKTIQNYQHYYYYCNRTGTYNPRGSGKRGLKSQGTSKINASCSACIKAVRCLKTDSVSITYIPTHYNHDQKLGHLRLSNSTKNSVAEKLKEGVGVSHIIDSFRNSEMADGIFRDHLITEKDINNIRKRFNVDGIQKHSNDFVSVANIVGEMQTLDYNSILLYKQQGEEPSEECKLLNTRDFLLVVQTEFQKDMLFKHGSEGVCMDATYNVNNYDFHLITLLVLDDYQEGIPAAYAISNREDKVVIKYILESIKLKCKGFKSCSWFMSDMALQYFNAWKEVFDTTNTKYLWCGWHIDRAWRKAIKRYLNSFEEQKEIYHQLRTLMMETSQIGFKQLLTKFLTTHKSTKFMEYFQSYCNHCEQWALCFRPGSPMNTNMYAESFHRVLKIVYLNHKFNRRLDKLLYIILKIARDKAFQQLCKKEKGKHTNRICDINKRHDRAKSYFHSAMIIREDENEYKVSSERKLDVFYTVRKEMQCCDCKLKCRFCYACSHLYSCTCIDSYTNNTVCKHIHLIQMKASETDIDISGSSSMTISMESDLEYYQRVTSFGFPTEKKSLSGSVSDKSTLVKKINSRLSNISSICNQIDDTDCLESIYIALEGVLDKANLPGSTRKRTASNKNSEIQTRYYTTKIKPNHTYQGVNTR